MKKGFILAALFAVASLSFISCQQEEPKQTAFLPMAVRKCAMRYESDAQAWGDARATQIQAVYPQVQNMQVTVIPELNQYADPDPGQRYMYCVYVTWDVPIF